MPININKIFGIGLSRTATTSLTHALEILGYTASHWDDHHLINQQIINNDFELDVLKSYDVLTDLPIPSIYQELDKAYPGSKFILTIRDADDWLRSARQHYRVNVGPGNPSFNTALCYGSWYFDEAKFKRKFQEHMQEVKAYFEHRPDDLLIINICAGEGWEKLCLFLGKEVPLQTFPFKNQMDYSLTKMPQHHPEKRLKALEENSIDPIAFAKQKQQLAAYEAELAAVYSSKSWRLMRALLAPVRWAETWVKK